MENPEKFIHPSLLSDSELYQKCQQYGKNVRYWLKQFAALLPEIDKRQVYRKHGFYSIYEFAGTLANMNHETAAEILRVAEKIEDKPALKNLLATEGWSKVKVVVTITTQETDQFWAKKVRDLPKHALETYVREFVKSRPGAESGVLKRSGNQATIFDNCQEDTSGGLQELRTDQAVPSGESPVPSSAESFSDESDLPTDILSQPSHISIRMFLEPDIELRFRELQKKLSKEYGGPIGFNEVVKELLNFYEFSKKKNAMEPPAIAGKQIDALAEQYEPVIPVGSVSATVKTELQQRCVTRYIPANIRKLLKQKYHGRCGFPNCMKLPEIFHHTRRFSLHPNHDPDFLIPLCKSHERIAHLGLIGNEEQLPDKWYVRNEPDRDHEKFAVDEMVNRYRTP